MILTSTLRDRRSRIHPQCSAIHLEAFLERPAEQIRSCRPAPLARTNLYMRASSVPGSSPLGSTAPRFPSSCHNDHTALAPKLRRFSKYGSEADRNWFSPTRSQSPRLRNNVGWFLRLPEKDQLASTLKLHATTKRARCSTRRA